MTHSHVAGSIHADVAARAPGWLSLPEDVNSLLPQLWSSGVSKDANGQLVVAGVGVRQLSEEVGTPAYVVDEADFRSRARAFAAAFDGWDVYYAAKSFLCTAVARWVVDEGLGVDVCTGGELAVVLRAGVPPARIAFHGNNKSQEEIAAALEAGVGHVVVDSFDEIARLSKFSAELGVRPGVLVRVTTGVEAHTHEYIATAHEDQKFGFSIAGGSAAEALRACFEDDHLELLGIHSHIGSQILRRRRVRGRRPADASAVRRFRCSVQRRACRTESGRGLRYRLHQRRHPFHAGRAGSRPSRHHRPRMRGARNRRAPPVDRARSGDQRTQHLCSLPGGHGQARRPGRRSEPALRCGRRGNERQHSYRSLRRGVLGDVGLRRSTAAPALARIVGKHCEGGDILVRDEFLPSDIVPGDLIAVPASGAYSRSMASNYNHVPRPPVVAVTDGEIRTLIRRETIEDLLALDNG